ncbi:hypothetical protein [Clostridium sp.]|uniref:hypothetical protein n=1 Tax=Clostridium sp. TaxID=1506 RepID=UPI001D41D302|nr:hypothetical protein [Clostridium sp.]MBS5307724.1 hypothetical protein [Clostridium sp.]
MKSLSERLIELASRVGKLEDLYDNLDEGHEDEQDLEIELSSIESCINDLEREMEDVKEGYGI